MTHLLGKRKRNRNEKWRQLNRNLGLGKAWCNHYWVLAFVGVSGFRQLPPGHGNLGPHPTRHAPQQHPNARWIFQTWLNRSIQNKWTEVHTPTKIPIIITGHLVPTTGPHPSRLGPTTSSTLSPPPNDATLTASHIFSSNPNCLSVLMLWFRLKSIWKMLICGCFLIKICPGSILSHGLKVQWDEREQSTWMKLRYFIFILNKKYFIFA